MADRSEVEHEETNHNNRNLEEDIKIEGQLRPQYLEDYIGQAKAKETLKIYIEAAKARGERLVHVLFLRTAGAWKNDIGGNHRE